MLDEPHAKSPRVAIVTGASQGIGAGVAAAFRAAGYGVVGTARAMPASDDPGLLTVSGDIADVETAQTVVELTLEHFGRIDTLVNDAGIFIGKPFTEYTRDDYAAMTAVNLTGFFLITQPVIQQMVAQGTASRQCHDQPRRPRRAPAALASLTKGGLDAVTRSLAIEYAAAHAMNDARTGASPPYTPWAGWARSVTSSTVSCTSKGRRSSPARPCTSTAARPPDTDIPVEAEAS